MDDSFVGRSHELKSILAQLPSGESSAQGRVTAIAGSVGIGKSRLLVEIAKTAESRGYRVLWSERIEDPAAPPFFTWVLTLRSCLVNYRDDHLIQDLGVVRRMLPIWSPNYRTVLRYRQKNRPSIL